MMAEGHRLTPGDFVRILAMPSGIVKDLPKEEADFLLRSVGDFGRIQTLQGDGTAEVELRDRRRRSIHFVWMAISDIEPVRK